MNETPIFQFLYVREAKLLDAKELNRKKIEQEETSSNLHKDLVSLKQKGDIAKLIQKATDTFENGVVFNTISNFQIEFIEEEQLLNWVMQEIEDNSIAVNRIKNELSKRKIDFSKIDLLWNTLSIHSILENPIGIVDLIIGLIRLNSLLKEIKNKTVKNRKDIFRVMQSNVVLPQDIFPINFIDSKKIEIPKSEENNSQAEIENEKKITNEISMLDSAKSELKKILSTKLNTLKNESISFEEFKNQQNNLFNSQADTTKQLKETSVKKFTDKELESEYQRILKQKNATKISEKDLKSLSKSTQNVLSSLPIESVSTQEISDLVNQIDDKKSALVGEIKGGLGYTMSYFEGNFEYNFPNVKDGDENCLKADTGESYCQLLRRLKSEDPKQPIVNVMGIGDLKVIRQKLLGYEAGEIAAIKNVFAGEEFTRSHRDLKRTEDVYETETERETEEKNEISSTDRFEMSKEISEQTQKSSEKELGVSVTAGYGPVSVSANASFSSSASSGQSSKSASKFARETTEKASNSIREKTREKRSKTTINEIEIINGYKLINDTPQHKVGKYLWVNKIYENLLYNIGKRLMLEFYIPSPLSFYLYSKKGAQVNGVSVPKPIHPSNNLDVYNGKALNSYKDLTRDNVDKWITAYNVRDFKTCPKEFIKLSCSFAITGTINEITTWNEEIDIPNGYGAYRGLLVSAGGSGSWVKTIPDTWWYNHGDRREFWLAGPKIETKYKISGIANQPTFVYLDLECELTLKGYEEWQISVYNSIMEAYENMKSEYDSQLSAAQIQAGIQIDGNNPAMNQQIISEELQKWCVESILLDRFESWNAMKKASTGEPEIDFNQLKIETPIVSFMNRALEFNNLTYQAYPYFWGNKKEHPIIRELTDIDPKFMAALKAGYCRVIVPVSYGFETAVLHLINTGQVWEGGDLPVLGDPLFQSIVDEIKGEEYDNEGTPEGDPWQTIIPTNLVWLNNTNPDGQL